MTATDDARAHYEEGMRWLGKIGKAGVSVTTEALAAAATAHFAASCAASALNEVLPRPQRLIRLRRQKRGMLNGQNVIMW